MKFVIVTKDNLFSELVVSILIDFYRIENIKSTTELSSEAIDNEHLLIIDKRCQNQIKTENAGKVVKSRFCLIDHEDHLFETMLKIDSLTLKKGAEAQFYSFNVKLIAGLKKVSCDLYIKLGDEKFVKVYEKNTTFDEKFINEWFSNKVNYLYFYKNESQEFLNTLKSVLIDKIKGDPNLSSKLVSIATLARVIGLDPQTKIEVDAVISSIENELQGKKDFKHFLENIKKQESAISRQALLTSYVAGQIIRNNEKFNSYRTFNKIITAALFADFTLNEEAYYFYYDKVSLMNLRPSDRKSVLNHPLDAVKLLEKSKLFEGDVISMIEYHHEKPDGGGYPKGTRMMRTTELTRLFAYCYRFTFLALELFDGQKSDNLVALVEAKIVEDYGFNFSESSSK